MNVDNLVLNGIKSNSNEISTDITNENIISAPNSNASNKPNNNPINISKVKVK